jgi:hypothetical protein
MENQDVCYIQLELSISRSLQNDKSSSDIRVLK